MVRSSIALCVLVAASFPGQGFAIRQLGPGAVCCCMERECSAKGDATRVQITVGGTTYCCKPRSPSRWAYRQKNGCDKQKYTIALTDVATDVIVPDPAICAVETTTAATTTTIEETTTEEETVAEEEERAVDTIEETTTEEQKMVEEEECAVETTTTTTTTTIEETTTQEQQAAEEEDCMVDTTEETTIEEETAAEEEEERAAETTTTTTTTTQEQKVEEQQQEDVGPVDLTEFFDGQKQLDHFGTRPGSWAPSRLTYSCCCIGDRDAKTIACEMKDSNGPKKISYKGGCGGLSGDRYHSWSNMPGKYASYEGYGKCLVKREEVPESFLPKLRMLPFSP